VVLVVLSNLVELRRDPADPMTPTSGELVASAQPSSDGWAVRWQDGREDALRDRAAVEDLLIGHMKR